MRSNLREKGQALILVALAAVGLFALAALAIDGSKVFSERRHAQNAADTAVLAAALAKARGQDYSSAALARASSNDFGNDASSTVEVHLCSEAGLNPPCEGMPAGTDPAEFIQVVIRVSTPTTFARVIGREEVTSVVTAIARTQSSGTVPAQGGAALVALAPTGTGIDGQGNILLDVNNSGVFSNSSDGCSMSTGGNTTFSVDTSYSVVGGHCQNGNIQINGPIQGASQLPYPPAIDITPPSITCSGPGSVNQSGFNYTYSPGSFNGLSVNTTGNVIFTPGNYCFNGSVIINGVAKVSASSANFLVTSGDFQLNGNSKLTCNDVLFHINGGTGIHFNGNAKNECNGITFFASTGDVSWNGTVANTFSAPGSGPYAHVLIYMPYGNTSPLSINGNSGNELTGSIIAVSSNVTLNGNSGTTGLHSAITGYTVTLAGNSNTVINYVPGEQYSPAGPATIELTK